MAGEYDAGAPVPAAGGRGGPEAAAKKRRHRFQTVHERVAGLQRELQLVTKSGGAAGGEELTFLEELRLQGELTTLDSFQLLGRRLLPLVATTPQLLHHLPKVATAVCAEIERALQQAGAVTKTAQDVQRERLVPLLKLVTALARELRREFYPHFAKTLPLIVAVIDTKDPELSTHAFKTLSMLFHYLRAQLLADMDAVHKCYFPLLGHSREFVREFAAQTLAVLLRRVDSTKQLRKYLGSYLRALTHGSGKDDEILLDGSAKLFFALVRNVNHGFHSRMRDIVLFLLASFRPKDDHSGELGKEGPNAVVFTIVRKTCELMIRHTDAEQSGELLECLALAVTKAVSLVKSADADAVSTSPALYLSRLVSITWAFIRFRHGKLVLVDGNAKLTEARVAEVHGVCKALMKNSSVILASQCFDLREVVLNYFETVWRLFPGKHDETFSQVKAFFTAASSASGDDDIKSRNFWWSSLMSFSERTLHHTYVKVSFIKDVLFPAAMQWAFESLLEPDARIGAFSTLMVELAEYVKSHGSDMIDDNEYVIMSKGQCFLRISTTSSTSDTRLLSVAKQVIDDGIAAGGDASQTNQIKLALAWKLCKALSVIRINDDALIKFAQPILSTVKNTMAASCSSSSVSDVNNAGLFGLQGELWRLEQIAMFHNTVPVAVEPNFVENSLESKAGSHATLSVLLDTLRWKIGDPAHDPSVLSKLKLPTSTGLLLLNLRSPSHELRIVSLEILAQFETLEYQELASSDATACALTGPCEMVEVCVALERACATISVETEREVIRLLTRVKILSRSPQTPDMYKQIAVNHLLGLLHVKFSTIWPHISEAIEPIARSNFSATWKSISAELLAASWRQEAKSTKSEGSEAAAQLGDLPLLPFVKSLQQEYSAVCALETGRVDTSVSTDFITHHSLLWKSLEKFIDLVETKTKFIVPLFLVYLRDQYRVIYHDELDEFRLAEIEVLTEKISVQEKGELSDDIISSAGLHWLKPQHFAHLTTKSVRNKLIDFLKLFGAFRNLKGAYAQGFLHDFFFDLLVKSDEVISKLALQCLYGFDKKHLAAYRTQLDRITDSATFREELTNFDISEQGGAVLREHRRSLVPVLMRILYSKCVSKKGRGTGDTVAARRAAILSYLAALEPVELQSFIELVVRAFNVKIELSGPIDTQVTLLDIAAVQPSRVMGFLNLLDDLIGQLGVKLSAFVPTIANVLVAILKLEGVNDAEDNDDNEKDAQPMDVDETGNAEVSEDHVMDNAVLSGRRHAPEYTAGMRKQLRMLTMRRFVELIDTFDTIVTLSPWVTDVLATVEGAVLRLPKSVVGADKASALMELMLAVARADRSRDILPAAYVLNTVSCLSAGLAASNANVSTGISPSILEAVLQFMGSLLDGDERPDRQSTKPYQLIPHISFVLQQFVIRFEARSARYTRDRYAGSARKEFTFLCRLSSHLEHYDSADGGAAAQSQAAAHDLFQLLLPFLQRSHRASDVDKENILLVLAQIVPRLSKPAKHVLALTKLLAPGPNAVSERQARAKLVEVFAALGRHPESKELARVAEMLTALNAYDAKRVEDVDFERRMDALNQINASKFAAITSDSHLLAPILAQYMTCMHDPEYSIRSGALVGLSTFVELAAAQASGGDGSLPAVLNALESLVMPSVRFSLRSPSEDVRRGFVSLLGHIADFAEPGSTFQSLPYVHGDLAMLRNRDDPEADFFYNITHIQAHRKRRALLRLGSLMAQMGERQQLETSATAAETEGEWFSNSTVNNILLPLLMHFIYEAQAKAQESIRSEAASCIGRAGGLLRWSHYLSLLRRLLKSIDGHSDAETTIISTVCEVIDHFHFAAPGAATEWQSKGARELAAGNTKKALAKDADVTMENEDDDDEDMDNDKQADGVDIESSKVQDAMEAQVLPMLKKYLFKGVTSKGVAKTGRDSGNNLSLDSDAVVSQAVRVRVPLALAVVKVLRRLRAETFFLELPKLLLSFTKLLKSKDEAIRTSARLTLVNITQELGLTYLLPIVDELRHTLREGYMVHVLSYTLHSILVKVSTMVEHSKPSSLLEEKALQPAEKSLPSPLDSCIPVIMEILVEELFFDAIENQDGSAPHKSKMKEAKASGSRGYDTLELLARSMAFLPNPSIHAVLSALVNKFRALEAGHDGIGSSASKALTILRDSLKRVALGLTKNPAVERSYVCLFAYNLMTSCLEAVRPATEQERSKYQQAGLVTSWLVNEKSAEATRALASSGRVRAMDTAKVLAVPSRMTGYDRHDIGRALADEEDDSKPVSTVHLDELLTFAVLLVHSTMKRSPTVATQTTKTQLLPSALVDPLIPLLMRSAAEAKNDRAVIQSLKCLTHLLSRDDLNAIDVALDPLVRRLFKIMQKAGAATRNEMVQTCYRALTAVLTARPFFRLTEAQLRVALSFVRADLDEREHQNATYALLRAVISSRLVVNEVYDVVLRVGELLVQSDAQSARSNCRAIYVTFLLEYPLGPKRVAQHLNFLMNNLSYTYESGRAAVLDALCVLLRKLPAEIINERAQFFLLPLVLRLANDDAAACRSLAGDAITSLIRRMGAQELNECIQLIIKWWHIEPAGSEESKSTQRPGHELQNPLPSILDPKLLCAAAQVTTLALRARPECLARKPQNGNKKRGASSSNGIVVLDNAARALVRSLADVESADDNIAVEWQVAYYVVECLLAWSEHLPGLWETWLALSEGKKSNMRTTFLDKIVLRLLEYPHAWVRLSTMRLLNSYLKRRSAKTLQLLSPEQLVKNHMDRGITKSGDAFLKQPGMLFLIASRVSKLFDRNGGVLDEEMATEVLVTLPFMLESLASLPDIPQHVTEDVSYTNDEEDEEVHTIEEEEGDYSMDDEEKEARSNTANHGDPSKPTTPVGWLLTRFSYVSRAAHSSVQMAVFKLFAVLITTRDVDFVKQYVTQMINPLYRVSTSTEATKAALASESTSGSTSTPAPPQSESALLAHEVLSLLEQKLGATEFLEAYTFVQRKVATFRATRKQQRKRELVNDPARAAARKIQKNDQKRRSKQLKKRKFAVLKGTVSAATRPRKVIRPGAE